MKSIKSSILKCIVADSSESNDNAAIVAIINSMTGQSDTSYLSALNTLVVQLGGEVQESIINGLNALGTLVCPYFGEMDMASDDVDFGDEEIDFATE